MSFILSAFKKKLKYSQLYCISFWCTALTLLHSYHPNLQLFGSLENLESTLMIKYSSLGGTNRGTGLKLLQILFPKIVIVLPVSGFLEDPTFKAVFL